MRWDDVNVRAAGLVTHLLDRPTLLSLAEAGTWSAAARLALDRGFPAAVESIATIGAFDRAVGLVAASRIALLERWLGTRAPAAAILIDPVERTNLRILLRGVVQNAAPAARLRGTIPGRGLPARALESLAAAPSLADFLRRLGRIGHPAARALAAAGHAGASGLFGLELALARVFAARAVRQARRGGRAVRAFAAHTIDLDNAWSLLAASQWGPDAAADRIFLPGGHRLAYPD
ncbi:MAG: V-type ATPase subunit, partial [Gemmatimonadales bacterium]